MSWVLVELVGTGRAVLLGASEAQAPAKTMLIANAQRPTQEAIMPEPTPVIACRDREFMVLEKA